MFKNCTNLAYINLINAVEYLNGKSYNLANILLDTMDNMVFCIKNSSIPKILKEMEKKFVKYIVVLKIGKVSKKK